MFGFFTRKRRPTWRWRIERKVDELMADFADLKTALDAAAAKVASIKNDTNSLLAKISALQANPPSGITPEQQAQLDDAVATAQNLVTNLGAIDDQVPDEPAPETPAPAPEAPTA